MNNDAFSFLHKNENGPLNDGNGRINGDVNGNGNGDNGLVEYVNGFLIRPGLFHQNGAYVVSNGVSFTVTSIGADWIELALFRRFEKEPFALLPFPPSCRIGNVYSMIVFDIDYIDLEYCYRVYGPYEPEKGLIFDGSRYCLDPYGLAVTGQSEWCGKRERDDYRSRIVWTNFDWRDTHLPEIRMEDLVIYELHVRGFTRHASSGVRYPGTFAGMIEKIPYLLDLGVNCVELMPVFEFDELLDERYYQGERLIDYWGYNPISFFAPNTSYSSNKEHHQEGSELKKLIRELHRNGIEVILDVVFNHTAEGDEKGPVLNLKGFDNNVYYMLTPDGKYQNFSGCGNTLNANHPIVQQLIRDSLRYWVTEFRVDGFRFDLASILGRSEDGSPLNNPPLLKNIAYDPILSHVKLIAEAWDAGGLYQVGSFPSWKRWSEWNGRYRDDLRRFLKGDADTARTAAVRIAGSHDIYHPDARGNNASINFITCHDGFTLHDLYAYNEKHNLANGWDNTDGDNHNLSWNCGVEGESEDPEILALRRRMAKNALTVLLASHGTPMLRAGDEMGKTQRGNNNAYCQDNEISWLDWDDLRRNADLYEFCRWMIHYRKSHPSLRNGQKAAHSDLPPVSYHGQKAWFVPDDPENRFIGVLFSSRNAADNDDEFHYLGANAHWEAACVELPSLPDGFAYRIVVDTGARIGAEYGENADQRALADGELKLAPRSVVLLAAVRTGSPENDEKSA